MRKKEKLFVALALLAVCLGAAAGTYAGAKRPSMPLPAPDIAADAPAFDASGLKKYDGTDPALPIYMGLDGYVYDVTAGKKYYEQGGVYHFLAGKDSSSALHIFGDDIIKSKYPVAGRLR